MILDRIRIRSNFDSRINIRHRPLLENRIRIQPYYFKTRIRNPTCLIIIIIIDTIFQGNSNLEAIYVFVVRTIDRTHFFKQLKLLKALKKMK